MDELLLKNKLTAYGYGNMHLTVKPHDVSTNLTARESLSLCDTAPRLITADSQSGGRGRTGKSFLSPEGGIYMTLALRSDLPLSDATRVTPAVAVALIRALRSVCHLECGIKWVNDIYVDSKKLAGILVESVNDYDAMRSRYLIIGIGINHAVTPHVTDSSVPAVSLRDLGVHVTAEEITAAVTAEILNLQREGFAAASFMDEYRRSSVVLGKEIRFTENGVTHTGIVRAILDDGSLDVLRDGETVRLFGGEISVRLTSD